MGKQRTLTSGQVLWRKSDSTATLCRSFWDEHHSIVPHSLGRRGHRGQGDTSPALTSLLSPSLLILPVVLGSVGLRHTTVSSQQKGERENRDLAKGMVVGRWAENQHPRNPCTHWCLSTCHMLPLSSAGRPVSHGPIRHFTQSCSEEGKAVPHLPGEPLGFSPEAGAPKITIKETPKRTFGTEPEAGPVETM